MKLDNDTLQAHIEQKAPQFVKNIELALDGTLTLDTARAPILDCLQFLSDDEGLQFHFLTSLCCVHYPDHAGREFGIVYLLHNWRSQTRLRVKIFFPADDPHVPSATALWPTANWMERQEYDFFGIIFTGHPDLKRILNVDDLDVFPMRKEYRLEDGTRTDKDDRFFGRTGNFDRRFD